MKLVCVGEVGGGMYDILVIQIGSNGVGMES